MWGMEGGKRMWGDVWSKEWRRRAVERGERGKKKRKEERGKRRKSGKRGGVFA